MVQECPSVPVCAATARMDGGVNLFDFLSRDDCLAFPPGIPMMDEDMAAAIACLAGEAGAATSSAAAALKREHPSDDDGQSDDEKASKKPRGDAAKNKACREKARREKMNERFNELARLIDPGREPKVDKSSILTDAIKYVQHLYGENNQLKQLNKFLEERVSHYERERGQALYQCSLAMQGLPQQAHFNVEDGSMQSINTRAGPSSASPFSQQQLQQGAPYMVRSMSDHLRMPPQQQALQLHHQPPQGLQLQHQPHQLQQPAQQAQQQTLQLQQQQQPQPDTQPCPAPPPHLLPSSFSGGTAPASAALQPYMPPAGLKPAMAGWGGAIGPPVSTGWSGQGRQPPGDATGVPPFWVNPGMLDSTQDSLLRPSLA